jgi:hypothetical protein
MVLSRAFARQTVPSLSRSTIVDLPAAAGYSVVTEEKGEDDKTPAGSDVQRLVQQ